MILKHINYKLMSTAKAHSVSLDTCHVQSECLLPESTNQGFLPMSRQQKTDQTGLTQRL